MVERRTALSFTLLRENSLTDSVCTSGETQRNDKTAAADKTAAHRVQPPPRITCCFHLSGGGFHEEESGLTVGVGGVCSGGGCGMRRVLGEQWGLSEREGDGERTRLLSQGGDTALRSKLT